MMPREPMKSFAPRIEWLYGAGENTGKGRIAAIINVWFGDDQTPPSTRPFSVCCGFLVLVQVRDRLRQTSSVTHAVSLRLQSTIMPGPPQG